MTTTMLSSQEVVPHPTAPETLEASGLSLDLVLQLVLKTLHFAGELSGSDLSRRIGLSFSVLSPAIDLLKTQQQVQIVGGGFVGGASYRYRITDSGRTRAALFLENSLYVGYAPVPLRQYQEYMRAFRAAAPRNATQDRIRACVRAPGDQRQGPRPARARNQRRPLDVRLRTARKRQDGHFTGDPVAARRRDRHPPRARSGGQHHPAVRPGQPRRDRGSRRRLGFDDARHGRSALGALQAADGHGRRRADAAIARAEL